MQVFKNFFLFCSGIHSKIIKRAPSDSNKYAGIGATVFFTGLFAMIASSFAVYTVFKSYTVAVIFGLIWGMMIFNLDRYIVMSMKKKDDVLKEILVATPRLLLAVLIAFVISKPLELKLFQSEISSELVVMEQEAIKEQESVLKSRFNPEIAIAQNKINGYEKQLESARRKRDERSLLALQEADGTGGSMQKNLGPIYKAKLTEANLAQSEYEHTMAELSPLIDKTRVQIQEIENLKTTELAGMTNARLDGFAAQLDALGRLSRKSNTIWFASLFIVLLFIAIETAPIFTKLISERSPYDYKLDEHESIYKARHSVITSRLNNAVNSELVFDKEIHQHKTRLATEAEKNLLQDLIGSEVEKIKSDGLSWGNYIKNRSVFSSFRNL